MDIIRLNNISKSFGDQKILNDFSYSFKNNGLYLLYGPSGSGKTTLLNIIMGLTSFEGSLDIYNNSYIDSVDNTFAKKAISYITQNSYFINYLTVFDNLRLCQDNSKIIYDYLDKFSLLNKKDSYPNELSGGEKERVSIISALLQNKKILILDEPTASLDKKNRDIVFKLLSELKKDILIICATHDNDLKNICDEVIDFESLKSKKSTSKMLTYENKNAKQANLIKFMLKSLTYKNRERKSGIFLICIFIILLLLIYGCYDYTGKIEKGLLKYYKINFVKYYCDVNTNDYCDSITKKYNALYNTFDYSENLPLTGVHTRENTNIDYNLFAKVLPFDMKVIDNVNEKLIYGTYYKNENDIILGYNVAKKISSDIKSLINTTYKVKLVDDEYEFNICGILKEGTDDVYFKSLFDTKKYNDFEFLNSKFTEKYKYDDIKGYNEIENNQTYMIVYFQNSKDLTNFYNYSKNNKNILNAKKLDLGFLDYSRKIQYLNYYATPAVILAFVVTILFYFQTQSILNRYNKHTLAIYNYYGYNYSNILFSSIIVNVISILLKYLISVILSVFIYNILNFVILRYKLLDFELFKFDLVSTLKLSLCLFIMSIILSTINNLKMKKYGVLNTLKQGDDLL